MDRALPPERGEEEETVAVVVPRGRPVAGSADVDNVARTVTRPEAAVVEECLVRGRGRGRVIVLELLGLDLRGVRVRPTRCLLESLRTCRDDMRVHL